MPQDSFWLPFLLTHVKASVKAQAASQYYVDNHRNTKKKKTFKERKNKSNSSSSSGFFDIAPSQGDDFDLSDPTLSVKPSNTSNYTDDNNNNPKKKNNIFEHDDIQGVGGVTHILPADHRAQFKVDPTISIPKSMKDEAKVARILKTDMKHFEESNTAKAKAKNKIGHGAYSKDTTNNPINKANKFYEESLQAMKRVNTSTHRHEKRKGYLLDKKKLSKKQKQHKKRVDDDDDYLPTNDNNKRQESSSSTGYDPDSAERPPEFNCLPKYAKKKQFNNCPINTTKGNSKEMEALRAKVQNQYQVMKLKRRKKGEFHL